MTPKTFKSLTTIVSLLIVLPLAWNSPSGTDPHFVAAFTRDPHFGAIAAHENGKTPVEMTDSEGDEVPDVTEAIWDSPEEQAVVVHKGHVGFSFAATSHALGNSARHLAAPTLRYGLTLEDALLVVGGILNVAACIFNSALAAANFAWYPVAGLSCSSAISVVKAIATEEAPYKEFADLWTFARDELARTRRLERSQPVQDFLAEMPEFALREPEIVEAYMSPDLCGQRGTEYWNTDYFFPSANVIMANAAADTHVRSDWFAESVEGRGPNSFLGSYTAIGEGPELCLFYDAEMYPWPTGVYRVDIYLNGSYAKTLEFTVQAAAELADAYMSLDENGNQRTDEFGWYDTLYANIELVEAANDVEARLEWFREGQPLYVSTETLDGDSSWVFFVSPEGVWPSGSYWVEIYLNDSYTTEVFFYVNEDHNQGSSGPIDNGGQGQTDFDGRYEGEAYMYCPSSSGTVVATFTLRGNQITDDASGATARIDIDAAGQASWSWNTFLGLEEYEAEFSGAGYVEGRVTVYGYDPNGACSGDFTGHRTGD